MEHGLEFLVIEVICFILVIGAAVRMLSNYFKWPYTIAVMVVGMVVGFALTHVDPKYLGLLSKLTHPETISPDLIIFIFLPILIFESAYSLEVHSFQRSLSTVLVLALPVLLVATGITGFIMLGLTAGNWAWTLLPCLTFGALISATDPVAVVALLRDLGAPKRLGLLIEGESLLNDGTAIVVFSLLLSFYAPGAEFHLGAAILKFFKVAGGGFVVGLLLARITTFWLSKTFNSPLIEITLTLALAYLCMVIAEGFLHVSGVIAIVTAGLWLKGPGKTNISPEVQHFLHQFLEMLAHIANTLIFFLVGVVVAVQLVPELATEARWNYLFLLGTTFVAIVIVRVLLLHGFRPLMNLVGDPVSASEVNVMAWGGLRGAVSLALALIVSQDTQIPEDVRNQILLLAIGVVLLTIVVNGTTMGLALKKLGFDKKPAGDRLAALVTESVVLDRVSEKVGKVSKSRDLRTVDWSLVLKSLIEKREDIHRRVEATRVELAQGDPAEKTRGTWRQVLNIERECYWTAFSEGTLSAAAAQILDHEIDLEFDRLTAGQDRPKLGDRGVLIPQWREWLADHLGRYFSGGRGQFEILSLRFDLCRAATLASEHVLHEIENMRELEPSVREQMELAYKDYHNKSKERLEDMRANLPELANAIETSLALRIQLNFERDQYKHMSHHGVLDAAAASQALADVELRMKRLTQDRPRPELRSLSQLVQSAPLFAGLEADALTDLSNLATEKIFAKDEVIFKQGDYGDSMIIVALGAVGVYLEVDGEERLIDTFGGGDILGEMALIADQPRTATLRAVTTVTTGLILKSGFKELMDSQPELCQRIRHGFAERSFDNYLRTQRRFQHLSHEDRLEWYGQAEERELGPDELIHTKSGCFFFLAIGELVAEGRDFVAPMLIRPESFDSVKSVGSSLVAVLPREP